MRSLRLFSHVRAAAAAAFVVILLPIINWTLGLIGLGPLSPEAVEHMGAIVHGIVAVGQELYWLIAAAVPVIVAYFKAPEADDVAEQE